MPSQSPGTTDRKGGDAVTLSRIEVSAYRHPISAPVTTSFGTMRDRPAVFVRLEDGDGAFGWGEIFANWPVAGAEHRARLLMEDIADLVLGMEVSAPGDLFHRLTKATRIRALQCGEWGPFRQVIAGLDTALHDLLARRAGLPVCAYLTKDALDAVPVYASGIDVRRAEPAIETARTAGMRNFKVKIGFDIADDARRVRSLAGGLAPLETLLTDANQAWTLPTASDFLHRVEGVPLGWLEEPIAADAPAGDWLALSRESAVPLAGGENIAGEEDFGAATRLGALTIFQPDIAKWGGFTGCLAVARAARVAGHRYCPHFLGGGIGLTASAHLLAAVGGDGLLEVDVNANPLRDLLLPPGAMPGDGFWHPGDAPGLGINAMPEEIASLCTYTASRHV